MRVSGEGSQHDDDSVNHSVATVECVEMTLQKDERTFAASPVVLNLDLCVRYPVDGVRWDTRLADPGLSDSRCTTEEREEADRSRYPSPRSGD